MSRDNPSYKQYLDSLLNILDDIVIFLSPEGIIQEASPLTETYFSWKLNTIKGMSFEALYQMEHIIPPFSKKEFYALRDKGKVIESLIPIDNKIIHLTWSSMSISPSAGFILIGRDVSKINELNLQHQSQYDQLEKILSYIPGNFFWKNKEGVYLGCSASHIKLLGFNSKSDVVGKTDWDLWPEHAEELIKNDQKIMQTGKTFFLEEVVKMPGEEDQFLVVIKMPLRDTEENIIGIFGSSLKITEIKNTQRELEIAKDKAEAASRIKTEFIANISHDIRTPLSGIIGCSHYLENHIKTGEEKEFAKHIYESGEQLLGLLNGVLDMITADSTNEDNVVRETFDLHQVIQDVLELERPAVITRHLAIKAHIDKRIPQYVEGDKMKLHRILLNLAGNAIKFTEVGHIELNAQLLFQEEDTVTIEFQVKDTGIGIPDDAQDNVFDRFFKVSPSSKGLYSGNGIGLHIAKKYVELLGGQLQLHSKEHVGTTFYFTLNMKQRKNHLIPEQANTPDATAINSEPLCVLLIEDNRPALTVLKKLVEPFTSHIATAEDAESAFLQVQQKQFDLIITDINLPRKSGNELTKEIRAYEKKHHRTPCPIIGLTGHSFGTITDTALNSGMNEVYQKPLIQKNVKEIIEKYGSFPKEQGISILILNDDMSSMALSKNQAPLFDTSFSGKTLGNKTKERASSSIPNNELPSRKELLFELQRYPLLDISEALRITNQEEILVDIFNLMIKQSVPEDLSLLKQAYKEKDWKKLQSVAHKIKSGALYVGASRMKKACQYLESYCKSGQRDLLGKLYKQAVVVIKDTLAHIAEWLRQQ